MNIKTIIALAALIVGGFALAGESKRENKKNINDSFNGLKAIKARRAITKSEKPVLVNLETEEKKNQSEPKKEAFVSAAKLPWIRPGQTNPAHTNIQASIRQVQEVLNGKEAITIDGTKTLNTKLAAGFAALIKTVEQEENKQEKHIIHLGHQVNKPLDPRLPDEILPSLNVSFNKETIQLLNKVQTHLAEDELAKKLELAKQKKAQGKQSKKVDKAVEINTIATSLKSGTKIKSKRKKIIFSDKKNNNN